MKTAVSTLTLAILWLIPGNLPCNADERPDFASHNFPETAFEYAKLVEPELGVPPKVDLNKAVEIPLYVNGKKTKGDLVDCDNPTLLGKGVTASGSMIQRYEGQTSEGKPLPHVVWVAFARHARKDYPGLGSVQMIGYNKKSGATAFFESCDELRPWVKADPESTCLTGVMPWIDQPKKFNKAYRVPGTTQCVECHQSDPFITDSFINAAKIPGTDESVVPFLDQDAPYYVIGGENWDMRTIHIEGNSCLECHRVGMATIDLFMQSGWDPNEHMPPHDPGSLKEDHQELLDAWKRGPENTPGAEWIIPPAQGKGRQVVGNDYPHKAEFNGSVNSESPESEKGEENDVPDDINFRTADIISEGTRMAAEVFSPAGATEKLPTIIMSHGWGGTADTLRPDGIAFARAGFLVITFDYRGWGNSDGRLIADSKPVRKAGKLIAEVSEVRGVVDPIDQTTDILNALHWVQSEKLCDPNRIGIWGSSFSGGHVVYVAARDPRVKAFVSQVGSMDARWAIQNPDLRKLTFSQGTSRTRGDIGYPEPFAKFGGMTGQPVWEKLMRYAPIEDIGRCDNCAKLFIIAENEELFDNRDHAIAAHNRAGGVKKLVTVEGIKHYGIYSEKRSEAQQLAIDWFSEHLKAEANTNE